MKKNISKTSRQAPQQPAPAPAVRPAPDSRVVTALHLGGMAAVLLLLRVSLLDVPLERDESAYAYLAKCALEGQAPYRDFYEMKPPLLFYAYGLLIKLLGYSQAGLHWAALLLTLVNAFGVYVLGRLFFPAAYAFFAGLAYILLTSNPFAHAIFAESELIVMAFALFGIYFLLRRIKYPEIAERPWGGRFELAAAGFLLSTATLVKQSGIYFFGLAIVALLLFFWGKKPARSVKVLLLDGLSFAAGALVPVAVCVSILQYFGVWQEFWFWNVDYVKLYASLANKDKWPTYLAFNWKLLSKHFELYWLLGALGLGALAVKSMPLQHRLLLLVFAVCAFLAVTPGRRFYAHYWLHFMPAVSLLMALLFFTLRHLFQRAPGTAWLARASYGLGLLLLAIPVFNNAATWTAPNPNKLVRQIFPKNPYAEDRILADFLAKRIKPEDHLAVLGSEPQFFVYLDKKSPSRHFYMAMLSRQSENSKAWQQEALDSLISQKPKYIVFNSLPYSWMFKPDSYKILFEGSYKWFVPNYKPIAWAVYEDDNNPKMILDESAKTYWAPSNVPYMVVLQRSDTVK